MSLFDFSVICAKASIVLVYLIFCFRLLGKRQLGTMNVYDLATIVALANAVQNAMTEGQGKIWVGIGAAGSIFVTSWLITRFVVKIPKVEPLIFGNPTLIVSDGQPLKERMSREGITEDELAAAAREHGLTGIDKISMAVLELDGTISIVPK